MAANLIPIQPSLIIKASAAATTTTTTNHKSDPQPPRKSWWTPLFGWSADPDYIESINNDQTKMNSNSNSSGNSFSVRSGAGSDPDQGQKLTRSRVSSANFTEEKARKLRMLTVETESFHDAMYHSAIASRLASDFSDRSDW
ncbi:hypothetical protein HanXRQr2_Chr09g0365971 [Helianthus annuus]|uniref:Uncharacterized protein n=1 Tax=Helianthus annuus TaxID=4232 RepID=A0A251TRB8_HELAN|nr:uncharacterized protein LOC110877231 [Helianthus annuus]KAF5789021.1 hypothetical protein HanXRQr2_Chr09g0365971 [Helianthus annuus]KAJ0532219.1 hypothetical protein HanIR_Chr09g0394271 [Helianthus annuus]KAJ0705877.1 hypothetical protein HanLR1_Chr09g0300441 [Helianthus annuus]KAJ0710000.1 hypothetical protein HanOQP8_Chr09g0307131 [Helianthus annuus]KAJ0891349.1 hypothetical protein HanPSC8_Chr09g0352661 [Helianthus annuus]